MNSRPRVIGMFRRVETIVFGLSVLVHAGVGWAAVRVEPRELPPPPPIVITVREVEPEPEPEVEKPEPEPEPEPEDTPEPEPEPEVVEPEPTPEPDPAPKPEPAPEPPPAPEPAPPAAPPEFGLEFGGASGPGGLDVPKGDPDGKPGGTGQGGKPVKKKVLSEKEELEPKAEAKSKSGCSEERIKAKPLKLSKPTYTEAARAAKLEGAVRLKLQVAADGSVGEVEVLQSLDPDLDQRAIEAAKAATFEAAQECGKPVDSSVTLSIRFSL
jgi:TonB family protein